MPVGVVMVVVSVPMIVVVMMVMVTMTGIVVMVMMVLLVPDLEVSRSDARSDNSRDLDVMVDTQTAECLSQCLHRQTGVEERRQQHVAGRARETLDVHHPRHGPSLDSLMEQYSTSARTRWSTRSTPISSPADRKRTVRSMSSMLGLASPEG